MQLGRAARLLGSAARNLYFDHGAEWAAALAYYSLLSVFPAALLAVTIATRLVDEAWAIEQIVAGVRRLLPTVNDWVIHDVREAMDQRGQVGVLAFLVLAWTGSRVFSTLTRAVDQALGRAPRRENFFRSLAREVIFLVLTGAILLVGTVAGFVIEFGVHLVPVGSKMALALTTALARTALFGFAMLLLYTWVPYPRPTRRAASFGALAATALLVLAMPLFSTYVLRLGQYNLIYGPLAIVIVVLVWFWVASVMVLYGAHVAALVEGYDQGLAGGGGGTAAEGDAVSRPRAGSTARFPTGHDLGQDP